MFQQSVVKEAEVNYEVMTTTAAASAVAAAAAVAKEAEATEAVATEAVATEAARTKTRAMNEKLEGSAAGTI